jgi:hypothetical protein
MKEKAFKIARARTEYPLTKEVLELPVYKRAAHCLDWCAKHYPYQWIGWNWLHQLILGTKRTAKLDSRDVMLLRGRASDVREVLRTQYGRTLTTNRELNAVRATVDSQDVLDSGEMEKHVETVATATRGMVRTAALVDPGKLKADTDRRKRLREFYNEHVVPSTKQLTSPTFQRRFLTPRREPKPDKK